MKKAKSKSKKTIETELIDLYMKLKVRKNEDIEKLDEKDLIQEREKLKASDPFVIINYIKTSIDILIDLKVEELYEDRFINNKKENDNKVKNEGPGLPADSNNKEPQEEEMNEYEVLLIKAEADIRSHLKVL